MSVRDHLNSARLHSELAAAEARVARLQAAIDGVRAIVDDWARDDTELALVTLPTRISTALDAALPTPVAAGDTSSNTDPTDLDAAGQEGDQT